MIDRLCERFGIRDDIRAVAVRAYENVRNFEYPAQREVAANVLAAFLEEGVAEHDFAGSTGYGYDDAARERYESLLCRIFGCERALARLSFVSGTHAIVAAMAAVVPPGKTLLSVTGPPYDTLRNAITSAEYNLVSRGVGYSEVDWIEEDRASTGSATLRQAQGDTEGVAAIFIQRSRGYAPRRSLSVNDCERLIARAQEEFPNAIVLVDNCYGELVETREPTHAGADLVMGSLIKNLGGTLAPAGGYVAGRADLVERVAAHVYAPGLRDALGPTLGFGRAFMQGLYLAPLIVEQTLRGLDFAAAVFDDLGYPVAPQPGATRSDIVQAIRLGTPDALVAFAQALQTALPVNARFRPEPGEVPGYREPVIMSSGAFVGGATIELSCDAPLREPFEVYLQGGVNERYTILGVLKAAQALRAQVP